MICNNFCDRLRKQWNFWLSLRALEEQSWTWMRSTCGSWWIMGRIWRPSERRTRSTRLSPWFPGTCPQWLAESPGQDSYTGRLNTQWKYSRPSPRFWRFVFGVLMMKIWHVFNFDNLLQHPNVNSELIILNCSIQRQRKLWGITTKWLEFCWSMR